MTPRFVSALVLAALVSGCGTQGLSTSRVAGQMAAAGAGLTGTQALAAFEKLPSLGRVKQPLVVRFDARPGDRPTDPVGNLPDSIAKIQTLAVTGLADAEKKETWNDRYTVTDAALTKIDQIRLATNGLNNVPAKVGIYGAKAYGYMGFPPTHENRFKVQAVALSYLRMNDEEATLAKGASIFSMAADMLEATTGWDQGFRVGLSVLTTLKENYKDREMAKACQALIEKSCGAPSKEEAYDMMVKGLRQMAEKLRR